MTTSFPPAAAAGLAPLLMPAVAELVPPAWAGYRPLIVEALDGFLGRLSGARLDAIVAAQLELPEDATAAARVVALARACPSLHKLGQVLARDRRLDAQLRVRLQTLESLPPETPAEVWLPLIRAEIGTVPHLEIAPQALAEASVAIVVPFARHGGIAPDARGVFKVLKPGIEAQLAEELAIWAELGDWLEARSAELGLPELPYRETLSGVQGLLLNEIRPETEQAHLAAACRRHAEDPNVLIPQPLEYCTPRLTAMTRIDGDKITEATGHRPRLARALYAALLAQPFWQPQAQTMFHADPHAGNLRVTADGRLAILDWSLVAVLDREARIALVRIVLAALAQDGALFARALAALGRPVREDALRALSAAALAEVRTGRLPGFDWLLSVLDRAATTRALEFPESLVLLRKALFTLAGVVAELDADCGAVPLLLKHAFDARSFDPRGFGPHVFAGDLGTLWLSGLPIAARWWAGYWQDWSGGRLPFLPVPG